ncbi:Txe/YoeB family addiction module toxin [Anaerovibrio sp.]|uniref:Txe/YoeB family addiction module toxin n=1 Tax=Anaerovibrio sp. TaxID=1872532 RepID=UPI003F13BE82
MNKSAVDYPLLYICKGGDINVSVNGLINVPFQNPPSYEKLLGNLQGAYSRRLNIKHRLVYTVMEEEKIVRIISMWSHYEF